MTAFTRLLAGAGRVRVLAAARVRTATAGSTAALRAAATRASALLRPDAIRSRIRDGSPRWRAAVRPAMDDFLDGLPVPADVLRRTRDSLLRLGPDLLRRTGDSLTELRWRLPSTDSLRPALRDLVQAVRLGGDGEEALRRRLLGRLHLRRRATVRRPRVDYIVLDGDEVREAADDDDRMAATLDAALRRLWTSFWDAFLDPHRLKMWLEQLTHKAPGQPSRRLRLRPARPRTTPRPISSSWSALRIEMIPTGDRLDWILLGSVALVDAQMAPGVQVQLDADTPPRPSTLAVSPQISASGPLASLEDQDQDQEDPYVAAVLDPGHLLLLLLRARPDPDYYLICDIASGTATLLPVPGPGAFLAPETIGIISRVDGDGYLVLALQQAPAAGMALVLCFDSRAWTWSGFAVSVDGVGDRPWSGGQGVVSHGGRIAWVDLRLGFLLLDAHGQERTLRYIPLPTGRVLPAGSTGVERLRCAALSQGVVRYAELIELDAPHIELWRFEEADRTWLRGGRVRLDAGLRTDLLIPWIAAIHPHKDVVFVTMGSAISAVDVRRGRVVDEDLFQLPLPEHRSSYFVRAWELA